MNGGSITDNTASNGGGVYYSKDDHFADDAFNISGSPIINNNSDNVYLADGKKINVAGPLADNASIGVTMANPGVFTSGYIDNGNGSIAPESIFTSDSTDYAVALDSTLDSTEATLAVKTTAYTVNLTGFTNATSSGGATEQTVYGDITAVIFRADNEYFFPETSDAYGTHNGITVTRTSEKVITVNGRPTADVSIVIPDASKDSEHKKFNISAIVDPDKGTIEGPEEAMAGDIVTFNITPYVGYRIESVIYTTGSGSTPLNKVSDYNYQLEMPGSDVTVTAALAEASAPANVRWQKDSSDKNTMVLEWQPVTGAEYYMARVYPTDGEGIEFVEVKDAASIDFTSAVSTIMDGQTLPVKLFKGEVYAVFKEGRSNVIATSANLKVFRVFTTCNDDSYGTVTPGGYYYEGQTATVAATPAEGYIFEDFLVQGTASVIAETDNPLSFEVDENSFVVIANFAVEPNVATVDLELGTGHSQLADDVKDKINASKNETGIEATAVSGTVISLTVTSADDITLGSVLTKLKTAVNTIKDSDFKLLHDVGTKTLDQYSSKDELQAEYESIDSLTSGTTLHALWFTRINEIDLTVGRPVCGTEIKTEEENDPTTQNIKPVVMISSRVEICDFPMFKDEPLVYWGENKNGKVINDRTVKGGDDAYAVIGLQAQFKYYLDLPENITVTVNDDNVDGSFAYVEQYDFYLLIAKVSTIHDFSDPHYQFADNYESATVNATCKNEDCKASAEQNTDNIDTEEKTDAQGTKKRVYTAHFTEPFADYSEEVLISYRVTFDPGNGETVFGQDIVPEGKALKPENPSSFDGWSFAGWYLNPVDVSGQPFSFDTAINSSITLKGVWKSSNEDAFVLSAPVDPDTKTYMGSVGYGEVGSLPTASSGTVNIIIYKDYQDTFAFIAEPAAGYEFTYWSDGTNIVSTDILIPSYTCSSEGILVANFTKADTATVTFVPGEGATVSPASKTVIVGKPYGKLPEPVYEGHQFLGWFTEESGETQITEKTEVENSTPHSLYAHWKEVVQIGFVARTEEGGSISDEVFSEIMKPVLVDKGGSYTLPDSGFEIKDEYLNTYRFQNYEFNEKTYEPGDSINSIENNITIKAVFAQTYEVAYDSNGGSGRMESGYVFPGDNYTVADNTFTNDNDVVFESWNTVPQGGEATKVGKTINYSEEEVIQFSNRKLTLYAQWVQRYTAVYDINDGGEHTDPSENMLPGRNLKSYTELGFSRPNYTFIGWNTEPDGSGIEVADGAMINDTLISSLKDVLDANNNTVVLYAQYKEESWIILDLDGGTLDDDTRIRARVGSHYIMPTPTRANMKFLYWQGSIYYAGDEYLVTEENHRFKAIWGRDGSSDDRSSYVPPKTAIE